MKHIKIASFVIFTAIFLNACQKEYSTETAANSAYRHMAIQRFINLFAGNMDSAYLKLRLREAPANPSFVGYLSHRQSKVQHGIVCRYFKNGIIQELHYFSLHFLILSEATDLPWQAGLNRRIYSECDFIYRVPVFRELFQVPLLLRELKQFLFQRVSLLQLIPRLVVAERRKFFRCIGDSSGNCKPVIISGVYTPGTALTAANTVQIQVTVAKAGYLHHIYQYINGIQFSKTGTFTVPEYKMLF